MTFKICCLLALVISSTIARQDKAQKLSYNDNEDRRGKIFSLFNIVTFPNGVCQSATDANRNGTCYTSSECNSKGGSAQGNCAAGFGVCCVFVVSDGSSSINENNSYIQNTDFPSFYSTTGALTYTINKCSSDICTLRLDFDTFTTLGMANTLETGTCQDTFTVTGTSGISTPVICGQNTGQHIYVEIGQGASDSATVSFAFATTTSTIRTWDIRVAQIPCGAHYAPPDGCLQWHMGLTGTFQTFNYLDSSVPAHLPNQDYRICIRQDLGYCCVRYTLCGGLKESFAIGVNSDATALLDTSCSEDFVGIDGLQYQCSTAPAVLRYRICGIWTVDTTAATDGAKAISLCDCSAPFTVAIKTDATDGAITGGAAHVVNRGVCLDYMQVPC